MLEGLHHVTAICADAPRNVDFYARVLGLRLVKKTVNFDAPDVYHLYYGDETGTPGSIMTFFEFPGAGRGAPERAWSTRCLAGRLDGRAGLLGATSGTEGAGDVERTGGGLRFTDPRGCVASWSSRPRGPDAPLIRASRRHPGRARAAGLPRRARYAARRRGADRGDARGARHAGAPRSARGRPRRRAPTPELWIDSAPEHAGQEGGGSVHHIAWCVARRRRADRDPRARRRGRRPRDRDHRSPVLPLGYFRTPLGVLFELASRDIGFATDEPAEALGEELRLPPQHERLRPQLEKILTPLRNPRSAA
jgi:glyoxalase family protein